MLNFNDFTTFIVGYAQYVCGILAVFGMLWLAFTLIKRNRADGLYVQYEESTDSFGNQMPLKKYVVYKGITYYLDDKNPLYKIMNEDYININNKLIKVYQ